MRRNGASYYLKYSQECVKYLLPENDRELQRNDLCNISQFNTWDLRGFVKKRIYTNLQPNKM